MRAILAGAAAVVGFVSATTVAFGQGYAPGAMSWTGFYIGAHAGGGWGDKTWSQPSGSGTFTGLVDAQGQVHGVLGGVQAGFNIQMTPQWLVGVEADVSWANIDGSFRCFDGFHTAIGEDSVDNCSASAKALGTIVGRAGGVVGNTLVYVLGGAAWIKDHFSDDYLFPGYCTDDPDFCATYSASETRWGWTIGAGAEYALNPQWSLKLQYNYMDFGTNRVTMAAATGDSSLGCPCSYDENIAQRIHTIKFGVNMRFH